jgi:PqqD family protein of HPr-rel-A system
MKLKRCLALSESGFTFDASTGESYTVNHVGARILGLLQDGNDEESIITAMLQEFDTSRSALEKHLADFFSALRQHGFLEA